MRGPAGPGTRTALLLAALVGVVAVVLGTAAPAVAHPINTSALLLDIETQQVNASIQLPLDQLSIARDSSLTAGNVLTPGVLPGLRNYVRAHLSATDASGRRWTTTVAGGRVEQIDGADSIVLAVTLTPSTGAVGDFVLHDDVVIDRLISHRAFVTARYGHVGAYTTLAMLSWQNQDVPVASTAPPPARQGFADAIGLGAHHIAGGSDHLVFLLMLLLPAPLLARGGAWIRPRDVGWAQAGRVCWRVVHVVTAFAVGHSITLALSALNWIALPARLVETGIAVSVLVSAIHAIRPLVHHGEVFIAAGFGLLHGLAFAATLQSLDLSGSGLVTTLLGFNLGIELTQLLVVAAVIPSLILLGRLRAYHLVRVSLAGLGAVIAVDWLVERIGLIATNPTGPLAELLVEHPAELAVGLAVFALLMTGLDRFGRRRTANVFASSHAGSDAARRPRPGSAHQPTWSKP